MLTVYRFSTIDEEVEEEKKKKAKKDPAPAIDAPPSSIAETVVSATVGPTELMQQILTLQASGAIDSSTAIAMFQAIAKDQLDPAHSRTVDGKRIITPQAGTSSWTGASSTSMTTFTGLLVQSFLFLYFCELFMLTY